MYALRVTVCARDTEAQRGVLRGIKKSPVALEDQKSFNTVVVLWVSWRAL